FLKDVSDSGRLKEFDLTDSDGYVQFVFALAEESVQDVFTRLDSLAGPAHLIAKKGNAIWAITIISSSPQLAKGQLPSANVDSQLVHPESEFGMLLDLFDTAASRTISVGVATPESSSKLVLEGTELAHA